MATTASVVCRSGYGAARYYAGLPAANDALILRFWQPVNQQDDDVFRDHETIAALISAGNTQCTAPGYIAKQITSGVNLSIDNTNNRVDVYPPNTTWTALGAMSGANSRQEISALTISYQPSVSSGTTSTELLLTKHYFPFIADGSDRTVPFPSGFYRAAG